MDYSHIESSQRQHHEILLQQERMNILIEEAEHNLFKMLKPSIKKDGDKWCVLYGNNIQEGICGFGETPYKAIVSFNKNWHKK